MEKGRVSAGTGELGQSSRVRPVPKPEIPRRVLKTIGEMATEDVAVAAPMWAAR